MKTINDQCVSSQILQQAISLNLSANSYKKSVPLIEVIKKRGRFFRVIPIVAVKTGTFIPIIFNRIITIGNKHPIYLNLSSKYGRFFIKNPNATNKTDPKDCLTQKKFVPKS